MQDARAATRITSRQAGLGFALLVGVVIIWVSSSELTKYLFQDEDFDKPFFITYLCSSSFSVYLLGFLCRPDWRRQLKELRWSQLEYEPVSAEEPPASLVQSGAERTGSVQAAGEAQPKPLLPLCTIIKVASVFHALWFAANYAYNLSLDRTSVSSNTILSSTSGFFTLVLAAICPALDADRFSVSKLVAVLLSVGGVVLVSVSDAESDSGNNTATGDIIAIFSALMYACYLVFLRRKTGERDIDMPLFLGFVGAITMVLLWPVLFLLDHTGFEKFDLPTRKVWLFLLANALIGTVLSELLWLRATLLTSPLVATLALSLTIPLAILSDYIFQIQEAKLSWMYILGTLMILASFFLINLAAIHPDWIQRTWSWMQGHGKSRETK
eukprot:m.56284 g.56284  ORF g.56284 m.56284 type:complete len:384 (-) comp15697_c0_seq2:92-1243(-)